MVKIFNKNGMSLVEVVVAIVLVALVASAMIAAVSQSSVFSRRVDMIYVSSYLAQRRIDLLKRLGFNQVEYSVETDVRVGVDGNIASDGKYIRTTEITTDYDSNPDLLKVKVTVQRLKLNIDGSLGGTFGNPVVMETVFSNVS